MQNAALTKAYGKNDAKHPSSEGKAVRSFRTPEGIEAERVTRDMLPDFLTQRGFNDVTDERKGHAQSIAATTPEGERIAMRVRLCWRRQGGNVDTDRARKYSAVQLMARIRKKGWLASLHDKVDRERAKGITHFLLVQNDEGHIVYAALFPISELVPIWTMQRDISQRLIDQGRLGRRRKNHAMNGSSPTLWLQDDMAFEVAQALWTHPGVRDLAKLATIQSASLKLEDERASKT